MRYVISTCFVCFRDADEYAREMDVMEDNMYQMDIEMENAHAEREELERINENLNRMLFDVKHQTRKKDTIIKKFQKQNKEDVLRRSATLSIDNDEKNGHSINLSVSKNNHPRNYSEYSHNLNPNNPFNDSDSDSSDWEESGSESDTDVVDSRVRNSTGGRFELVALNRRDMNASFAAIEKELHLENGLEALLLDDDEIDRLRELHIDKNAAIEKLKFLQAKNDSFKRKISSDIEHGASES